MLRLTFTAFLSIVIISFSQAQSADGIGIGTTIIAPHAILEVASENKGILVPRVSSLPGTLVNNDKGLLIYHTGQQAFYRWDGTWKRLIHTGTTASVSSVESTGDIHTSSGNITATTGNVIATGGDIEATNGDVSAGGTVSGSILSGTTVNATTVNAGTVDATGNVSTDGEFIGNGTIPVGGIIMWSGSVVPAGWALCDGANGTPDLANRFIMGASSVSSSATGTGDQRVALDGSLSSDYITGTSNCSVYAMIYTENGFYYDATADKQFPFSYTDKPASSYNQARVGEFDGTYIRSTSQSANNNPNYYKTNAECRTGAQFYKLAFIMRTD